MFPQVVGHFRTKSRPPPADVLRAIDDATERITASDADARARFPLDYMDITLKLGPQGHLSVPVTMSLPGFENAWSGYGDDTITGTTDRNVVFSGDRSGRKRARPVPGRRENVLLRGVDPLFPRGSCPRLASAETSRAGAAAC